MGNREAKYFRRAYGPQTEREAHERMKQVWEREQAPPGKQMRYEILFTAADVSGLGEVLEVIGPRQRMGTLHDIEVRAAPTAGRYKVGFTGDYETWESVKRSVESCRVAVEGTHQDELRGG